MGSPKTAIICQRPGLLGRVKKLGLSTKDLIPVALKMHAADNHDIRILGATILRLPPYSDYQGGTNNQGTNNQGEKNLDQACDQQHRQAISQQLHRPRRHYHASTTRPQTDTYPHCLAKPCNSNQSGQTRTIPPRSLQVQHQTLPLMEGPPMRQTHMPLQLQLPTIHQYQPLAG